MTKARLLDDDEEEQEFEPTIVVNEQFAKRFEHNKKREELHRLQEKHPELAARLARKAAAETARAARQAGGSAAAAYEDEDEDEESSSEDDDDEELLENDDTDKVLETLVRIKRKDPVIFQKDVVLFPEETAADADGEAAAAAAAGEHKKEKGSSKPVYLRTVLAKQALEGAAASSDDEDDNDNGIPKQPVSHSYAAEQQELKKAFLQAAEQALDGNEGEDAAAKGLVKKRRAAAAAGEGEAAAAGGAGKEQQVNELLDEYFGRDAELTEADAFLKAYLANKAWKSPADGDALGGASGSSRKRLRGIGDDDDGSSSSGSGSEDEGGGGVQGAGGVDEEEDEQFLEQVDRFEAAYNFRFEEPNSHRIQSFPRVIEDSVRRPDERRKRQRQAKAERQAAEREEREAELRRLKNLKKEEINDMLARIEKEAGIQPAAKPAAAAAGKAAKGSGSSSSSGKGGAKFAGLLDELLEGDFDPEEYDRRMAEAFDDDYYEGEEDAHELFGDAEEELAAEEDIEAFTDPSSAGAARSFAALRQKLKQQQQRQQQQHGSDEDASDEDQQGDSSNDEEEEEEGDGEGTASKAEKAAQHAQQRSQLQRLLEDYYKLDYEDNIGGLACRFKYREVPAESFGLTDEDVLALSDRQLNQIAGLRLLAPYREDSKRLRPNYKALQSIKGEAAAAAAMRRQKREREKQKERQKKQQPKQQQQGDEAQQQQQKPPPQQQQQQGQKKQMFGQQGQHQRSHHQQQQQQQHRHKQHHQQQQQKPLAEMTAEEKQAARLASYAKLTLKPSKQAQEQAEGLAGAAAAGGKGSKKRRAEQQQEGGEQQQQQQQKKKQKGPAVQPGRLAAAGVQLEAPLTKAQKKNLLRALKRKEKQQGQGKVPEADA